MNDILQFTDREEFRKWLSDNCLTSEGVWLLFGKAGGPKTLKSAEALEEALCFGWIDGQMQEIFFRAQGEKQVVGKKQKISPKP